MLLNPYIAAALFNLHFTFIDYFNMVVSKTVLIPCITNGVTTSSLRCVREAGTLAIPALVVTEIYCHFH